MTTIDQFVQNYYKDTDPPIFYLDSNGNIEGDSTLSQVDPNRRYVVSMNNADLMNQLYYAVAKGDVQVKPEEFSKLITGAQWGLRPEEFQAFSPEVQQWAMQNPQRFVSELIAHKNPVDGDLGTLGAEGGYSTPGAVTVTPQGNLDYSNAGYLEVHDDKNFFEKYGLPLALAGLGGYFLGPELLAGLGGAGEAAGGAALADLSGVAGMGVADFATSSALTNSILANYLAGGAGLTGFEGALAGLGGLAEGAGTIGATMDELSLQELLDQALGPNYNADILESLSGPVNQQELANILAQNVQSGNLSLSDVSKVYDAAKKVFGGTSGQDLSNLLAGGYGAYAQSNLADKQKDLAQYIIENADPYRQYRQQQEIPFMKSMLQKAPGLMTGAEQTGQTAYNTLADMFYQDKLKQSYTDPMAVYNSPEMQALTGQFMNQIARRDAAAGRTSQYGARALEGQNQFLTQALPAYRQGLVQGSGAQTQQGGALSNLFGQQGNYAQGIAKLGMPNAGTAGAGMDQYGNLMTGANTQGSFALNPLFGAVGANQGGSSGTNIGSTIAGLGSLANAGSNLWSGLTSLFD